MNSHLTQPTYCLIIRIDVFLYKLGDPPFSEVTAKPNNKCT